MNCVTIPDETLAVSIGGIEDCFELLYSLFRAAQTKDTLNTSGLFFEKDAALCDDYGNIAVNVTLPIFVDEGDSDVGICYALP